MNKVPPRYQRKKRSSEKKWAFISSIKATLERVTIYDQHMRAKLLAIYLQYLGQSCS